MIAQYRLSEWLGRFVVTLSGLVALLEREEDDLFVDRCQLLGSRAVVASRAIGEALRSRILRPQVFDKAGAFAVRVARELRERRRSSAPRRSGTVHLKESPGGLREIDLALAIAKAQLSVWDARGADAFTALARIDPGRSDLYTGLGAANDFLVAVRSAYRVTVAATDEIECGPLAGPARILGYLDSDREAAVARLFADIEARLTDSAALIDRLIEALAERTR